MELKSLMTKVFGWMFIGLLITFAIGSYVGLHPNMIYNLYETGIIWIFIILELILVIWLSARITKMSKTAATAVFIGYAVTNGITLSSIFAVYTLSSVFLTFGVTSIVFLIFALLGHFTKLDLSKLSSYLLMGLVGVLLSTLVNLFVGNETADLVISAVAILVFVGFTAYDVQKIKQLSNYFDDERNAAIYGALELYLDFINLFLHILTYLGKNKD